MNSSTNPRSKSNTIKTGEAFSASPVNQENTGDGYAFPVFIYLSTPKQTPILSPLVSRVDLPRGIVDKVWIEFPRGCAGLVGLRIFRGVTQIFPQPATEWFISDGAVFTFKFSMRVFTNPLFLTVHTYNLDDVYSHRPWLGFEMTNIEQTQNASVAAFLDVLKNVT